jgi:septum formation protein
LILASSSPRRSELLTAAGIPFIIDPAWADETPLQGEEAEECVERLALSKARAILQRHPDDAVVGADTTVVVDGTMLAKPADDAEAVQMLRMLSGREHLVLTGIAVVTAGAERTAVERTTVVMSHLRAEDIAWYVASGEPRDRAGAYAIQGLASRFIPRIEGSYSNVVGLPVAAVLLLVKEMGLSGILGE